MSRPLSAGERALLVDSRGRRYLVTLASGAEFHTHTGILDHSGLIGSPEGSVVHNRSGHAFTALRPTLADLVVKMPRGAQVIYPKDLGAILMAADIGPGVRVVEAGVGSGALSMALLRAGAEVVGYDVRPDFAERARANVAAYLGDLHGRYQIRAASIYDGIEESDLDRVVLDLPEPWQALGPARHALAPGGILVSYLPTVNQVGELRRGLDRGGFGLADTFEVLHRHWHVGDRSLRPEHRMVAHTGFITSARRLE